MTRGALPIEHGDRLREAAARGAPLRAPARDHPPRHQAAQRARLGRPAGEGERAAAEGDRLRHRAPRRVADDRGRLDHGHRAVPLAGAGARRAGDGRVRPLLGRRRPLRDAHRQGAVHRRLGDRDRHEARQRPARASVGAAPGDPAGARPDRPPRPRQGPRGPLPDRRGVHRGPRARRGRPARSPAPTSTAATALLAGAAVGRGHRAPVREPDARRRAAAAAADAETPAHLPAGEPVRRAAASGAGAGCPGSSSRSSSPPRPSRAGGPTTRSRTSSRRARPSACRSSRGSQRGPGGRADRGSRARGRGRGAAEHRRSSEGIVIEQSPKEGTQVAPGSTVTITCRARAEAGGRAAARRPDLRGGGRRPERGRPRAAARRRLLAEAGRARSPAQDPRAGEQVDEGTEVEVRVSKGVRQVEVPDVLGQSESSARAELEARASRSRSPRRRATTRPRASSPPRAPRPGTEAPEGSTVLDHDLDRARARHRPRRGRRAAVRRPGDDPGRRPAAERRLPGRHRPGPEQRRPRPEPGRRLPGELRLDGDHRRRPPRLLGRAASPSCA